MTMTHDVKRRKILNKWRKVLFALFIGGAALTVLTLMFAAPLTTMNDNWSLVGIVLIGFEAVAAIAGIGWLVLLVTSDDRIEQHEDGHLERS